MTAPRPAHDPVRAAVDELRAIRSTDPCASIAITTVKATIHTLETRWIGDAGRGDVGLDGAADG